jgi:hypothetical protein
LLLAAETEEEVGDEPAGPAIVERRRRHADQRSTARQDSNTPGSREQDTFSSRSGDPRVRAAPTNTRGQFRPSRPASVLLAA